MGLYRDEAGMVIEIDDRFAEARGYAPLDPVEHAEINAQQGIAARADERGVVGDITAAGTGFLSGATLGLSDVALANTLTPFERERVQSEIEAHPYLRAGGEIAGALTGAFAAPGSAMAKTPTGYLNSFTGKAAAEGLAEGGVRGTARALGAMGTEGAIQNAGQYMGHSALADKETTAEGLAGAVGTGFAFGAAGGGAAIGITRGAIAGRRLWSRVMDGPAAAKQAESAWSLASQEALDADLATARVAETKLDAIRKSKMEAMRYRNETRSRVQEESIAAGAVEKPVVEADFEAGIPTNVVPRAKPEAPLSGMPTSVFQRPRAPDVFEGPVPLDDGIAPASGGQATSVKRVEFTPEGTQKIQRPAASEAPTELESKLAGTKAQLDKGTPLGAIKAAKGNQGDTSINEWLDEKRVFDNTHTDPNKTKVSPYGPVQPKRRSFDNLRDQFSKKLTPDLREARMATLAEIRYKATEDLLGPALAKEEQRLVEVMDEFTAARKDVEHLFGNSADMIPTAQKTAAGARGDRQAIEIIDDAHEEALLRAKHAADPAEAGRAVTEAEELEHLLNDFSLPDISPGLTGISRAQLRSASADKFVEDLFGDVGKLQRYEEASAKLADAMGDQAHQTSILKTKALRDAEKDSMRKVMDRSSRAVDDVETFGPNPTPKERVRSARSRHNDAQGQLEELGVQEKEASTAFNKATKQARDAGRLKKDALRLDDKTARAAGKIGAQDVGGIMEIIDVPGIPKPSDLPIVGPIVGAYLKFRTLKRAMGRAMGNVPATADNRVAALASQTRDRVARAVDRSMGTIERGGRFATRALPPLTGILAQRIFDDGDEDPGKNAPITKQAAARMREISAYVHTPGAIEKDVRMQLRGVIDPDIIAAAEKHRRVMFEHLLKHLPKVPEQGIIKTLDWEPSPAASMSLARRLEAVNDPAAVYERLAMEQTLLSLEAAEAMREVYPQLFKQAQQRALDRAAEPGTKVPYRQRVQMTLFYKLPFDAALDPVNLQITQSVYDRKPAEPVGGMPGVPQPSVAQPTNIAQAYTPSMDRR